ncbi:MAG: hypothetical protein K8S62_02695 [Candidatus Sabulitectum sp.]|nr:hypothetical protein [Candidatus Sabulitectum sp.]
MRYILNATKVAIVLISMLVIAYYIVHYAPSRFFTEFDDAYMYCRYASNFLEGNGYSWNASDGAAYGATSSIYLFLITLIKHCFSMENSFLLSTTSYSAGLIGLLALVTIGYQTGQTISKWHIPILVIPLCLISSSFRYHSFTGMETTTAFAANAILVLSVILYSRKPDKASFSFVLLSAVFAFWVRPDNGVYSLLFPALFLLSIGRFSFRTALIYLLSFASAVGLILLVSFLLFGSSLPVPFYTKSGEFLVGYAGINNWNAVDYLLQFLRDTFPFIAVVILFTRRAKIPELVSILVPVVITFIYYATTVQIMGWFARYYFPSLPFTVMAAFIVLESVLQKRHFPPIRSYLYRVPVLAVLSCITFLNPMRQALSSMWIKSQDGFEVFSAQTCYSSSSDEPLPYLNWWDAILHMSSIVGNLPPGASVAATEYGYISAENPSATIVDMAGLHDMTLVKEGFSSSYILSQQPDLIWMPHIDYTFFNAQLIDDSAFFADYNFYPGIFNYGVAVRRNSELYTVILCSFEKEFSLAYPGAKLGDYLAIPE